MRDGELKQLIAESSLVFKKLWAPFLFGLCVCSFYLEMATWDAFKRRENLETDSVVPAELLAVWGAVCFVSNALMGTLLVILGLSPSSVLPSGVPLTDSLSAGLYLMGVLMLFGVILVPRLLMRYWLKISPKDIHA